MNLPSARVRLAARRDVARAYLSLNVDTSRQIDPFAALDSAGVLVFRRRLDHLAGLYLPRDLQEGRDVPAVLINLAHPLSKQRFTAAHELGHHLRNRDVSFDSDTELLAREEAPSTDRETFAAYFLMPEHLVKSMLTARDLRADDLDADGAYALSLDLGTSYATTVWRLTDMELLTAERGEQLLRVSPQTIKRRLGGTDIAVNPWKDVYRVQAIHPNIQVAVRQGDAIVLEAPEIPSSGYLWQLTPPNGLALVRDEYCAADAETLGGKGWHRFLFRVEMSGRLDVIMEMRRPWQHGAAAETAHVAVIAQPQPAPGIVQPKLLVAA